MLSINKFNESFWTALKKIDTCTIYYYEKI